MSAKTSIVDILSEVGAQNIQVQFMADCICEAKQRHGYTELVVATQAISPSDLVGKPRNVGIICWVTSDEMDAALARLKDQKGAA